MAVIDLIKERGFEVGQSFNMYTIGLALTPKGYSVDELSDAVEWMLREKLADIKLGTNSLVLLKPL